MIDGLKPGDSAVVQDGPFAGYETIFDMRLSSQKSGTSVPKFPPEVAGPARTG